MFHRPDCRLLSSLSLFRVCRAGFEQDIEGDHSFHPDSCRGEINLQVTPIVRTITAVCVFVWTKGPAYLHGYTRLVL